MRSRVKWKKIKGASILFEDYSGLKGDDLLEVLYEAARVLKNVDYAVPVLLDFGNTNVNRNFVVEIGRLGKELNEKHKKIAVLGISSIQQVIAEIAVDLSGTLSKVAFFRSHEEAIEYLTL